MSDPADPLCYLCAHYVATTLTGGGVRVCGKCLVALLDEAKEQQPKQSLGQYWRHSSACRCSACT